MLIADGVARLEIRCELMVGAIIEVQSSEYSDVCIGCSNPRYSDQLGEFKHVVQFLSDRGSIDRSDEKLT